jgi:uncharacterized protein YvpB
VNIPRLKQLKNSCGTTALRIVLKYYGNNVSESEVIKSVGGLKRYGVRTVTLAEFARKLGFKVCCLSFVKHLADNKTKIKKPTLTDIHKWVKRGVPVIVNVRSALLYNTKPTKQGHFIVITKYQKGYLSYNDPSDGKNHKITEESFQFAWFNNALDSSAYLLAIYK